MAAPTFGATHALLSDRFFGGTGITTPRLQTVATDAIAEVAAEVARKLRAVKVEPDSITAGHAADAYKWCQSTILYGAAAEYLRRTAQGEEVPVAEAWEAKYQGFLSELAREPTTVLGDLSAFKSRGSVRRVWT